MNETYLLLILFIEQFKNSKLAPAPIRAQQKTDIQRQTPPPPSEKKKGKKNKSQNTNKRKEEKEKKEDKEREVKINISFDDLVPKSTHSSRTHSSSSSAFSSSSVSSSSSISSPSPRTPSPRENIQRKMDLEESEEEKKSNKKRRSSIEPNFSIATDLDIQRILKDQGIPFQSAEDADKERNAKKQEMLPSDISEPKRTNNYD